MRGFFSREQPAPDNLLLVESGPRSVAEALIPRLRQSFGSEIAIDVLTYQPGLPDGAEGGKLYRVDLCESNRDRRRLLREVRSGAYRLVVVLCADSPYLAHWRTVLIARLPSKFLIANENADCFWLDRAHLDHLLRFWMARSGLMGESGVRSLARLVVFPLAFVYLLAYASVFHGVRWFRMLFGLARAAPRP